MASITGLAARLARLEQETDYKQEAVDIIIRSLVAANGDKAPGQDELWFLSDRANSTNVIERGPEEPEELFIERAKSSLRPDRAGVPRLLFGWSLPEDAPQPLR